MVVKLVDKDGNEKLFPCDHIEATLYAPGSVALAEFCRRTGTPEDDAAGYEIHMINARERDRRSVLIPTDYVVAHVINDHGRVTTTYCWPPLGAKIKKEAVG